MPSFVASLFGAALLHACSMRSAVDAFQSNLRPNGFVPAPRPLPTEMKEQRRMQNAIKRLQRQLNVSERRNEQLEHKNEKLQHNENHNLEHANENLEDNKNQKLEHNNEKLEHRTRSKFERKTEKLEHNNEKVEHNDNHNLEHTNEKLEDTANQKLEHKNEKLEHGTQLKFERENENLERSNAVFNREIQSSFAPAGGSQLPESSLARDGMAREQKTASRMTYWTSDGEPMQATDTYVLFTLDSGGPNNMRIGWEMTGVVAQATGRTLVLPPASKMYLLDYGAVGMSRWPEDVPMGSTTTLVEDLINLDQLKMNLPTLTWDEFESRTGLSWESAEAESAAVSDADKCSFPAYKRVQSKILLMSGSGGRREGFSCGEWWLRGGPGKQLKEDVTSESWSLLTHGFVWHEDAFAIASKAVDFLGIFEYSALHARYGDFQFTDDRQDPGAIMGRMNGYFKLGTKLYVASDEPDRIRELSNMKGITIVSFDDLLNGVLKDVQAQYEPVRWFKMLGLVEELICTYAKVFVGTGHSSFSGHIYRMRLHAQAPVTRMLIHGEDPEGVYDNGTVADVKADIDAWSISPKVARVVRPTARAGDEFLWRSH